ncbi:MAG TPA: glycosyltransferase [Terriglobales bacterium]|nr:glycosyltransferase [Terriglobales bacterium]
MATAQQEKSELKASSPNPMRGVAVPRKRKIFYLVDSLNIGGTETQAVELARRMDPAKYDVTLACLRKEGPLLERLNGSAVNVVEFHPQGGIDSPRGLYQLARMAAYLRRGKFDVVHAHDLWSNMIGVVAGKLAGVPVIVTSQRDLSHGDWYQGSRKKWLRRAQNASSAVVTNARMIREGLISEEGLAGDKVRVVYNGVDLERFEPSPSKRAKLFTGMERTKLIVLVGNMHTDVKGHPTLMAAAPEVVSRFPQARFILVGDGEKRKDFEAAAQAAGVGTNFMFLGRRNDVADILAACDIAVLPSAAEGMPNAVLEYMAAGLPVVASAVGGNLEVIADGETGLLVPAGDPAALSAALSRLLADDVLALRLARKGRELVEQRFSFERLTREVGALYEELLQTKGRA